MNRDDGHPQTSSLPFTLSVVYQHHLVWKDNYEIIKKFKRQLAHDFLFLFTRAHTRIYLLNKKPYHQWGIVDADRAHVIDLYCELCAQSI